MKDLAKCKRAYWAAKTQAKIRGMEWKYRMDCLVGREIGGELARKAGERKRQICNG